MNRRSAREHSDYERSESNSFRKRCSVSFGAFHRRDRNALQES